MLNINIIRQSTIPLFSVKNAKPISIGTAILLCSENRKFMLTAYHVIKSNYTPFFIPSENNFLGLDAKINIPSEKINNNQQVPIDLAILELSDKNINELSKLYKWIPINIESAKYIHQKNDKCILFGFPATKIDRNFKDQKVTNIPLKLTTYILDIINKRYFSVRFNRDHKYSENNRFAPLPYGMSGCGVWIFKNNTIPILIGIAIEYDKTNKIIKCVSIKDIVVTAE